MKSIGVTEGIMREEIRCIYLRLCRLLNMRVETWNTRKHWALLLELMKGNAGSKGKKIYIYLFNQKQNSGIQVLIHNEWMYCFQPSYHKDFLYLFFHLLFLEQSFKFACRLPHCSFQSNQFRVVCTYLYCCYNSLRVISIL